MASVLEEQVKTPVAQMGDPHLLITAPCARQRTRTLGQLRGTFRKERDDRARVCASLLLKTQRGDAFRRKNDETPMANQFRSQPTAEGRCVVSAVATVLAEAPEAGEEEAGYKGDHKYLYPEFAGWVGERYLKKLLRQILPMALYRMWEIFVEHQANGNDCYLGVSQLAAIAGRTSRTMQKNLAELGAKQLVIERVERKVFHGPQDTCTSRVVVIKDFANLYALAHEYHEWLNAPDYVAPDRAVIELIAQDPHLVATLRRFDNYRRVLYNQLPGPEPHRCEEATAGSSTTSFLDQNLTDVKRLAGSPSTRPRLRPFQQKTSKQHRQNSRKRFSWRTKRCQKKRQRKWQKIRQNESTKHPIAIIHREIRSIRRPLFRKKLGKRGGECQRRQGDHKR